MTHQNHFTALRLFAAWLVIVGHSYELLLDADFLSHLTRIDSLAGTGVVIFFSISGFLVTQSYLRDEHALRFLWRRALRIFPALWVLIFLSVFVAGPLLSRYATSDYFSSPSPYVYLRWLALQNPRISLPGVFENNPYPPVFNGSLWTLPLEATCYLMLAVLGVWGMRRKRWLLPALLALAVGVAIAHSTRGAFRVSVFNVTSYEFAKLVGSFLLGAYFATLKNDRWRRPVVSSIAVALCFGLSALKLPAWFPVWFLCAGAIAWCGLSVGLLPVSTASPFAPRDDFSYGLYLYAFPVQQALLATTPIRTPLLLIIVTTLVTAAIAFASWRWVEKPFLSQKNHANVRALFTNEHTKRLSAFFACLLIATALYGAWRLVHSVASETQAQLDTIAAIGKLESPRPNDATTLRGWVWHPAGTRRARVFIDDARNTYVDLHLTRTNLSQAQLDLAGMRHSGWQANLDAKSMARVRAGARLRLEIELHNGRRTTLELNRSE